MKNWLLMLTLLTSATASAQTPPPASAPAPMSLQGGGPAELSKKVETYLRDLFAWGTSYTIRIGQPAEAILPGFWQVSVQVTSGAQTEAGIVYVSKDGRYLIRGDVFDTTARPFAAVHSQIRIEGHPSVGPANAKVVLVEYSDFQCPHCRELAKLLKEIASQYPQVRFVFKDYPLTQIHPWAMTAALAGRCAYNQKPEAFWTLHDAIFENQDNINPSNAWNKMLELAGAAGLDAEAFRFCMTSPDAKKAVEENLNEGRALRVANTPTAFINGRRIVGAERRVFQQFLDYELAAAGAAPAPGGAAPKPPSNP